MHSHSAVESATVVDSQYVLILVVMEDALAQKKNRVEDPKKP